jgi:hypothetical protein
MSFYSNTPIMFGGISGVTATRGNDPEPGTRVNYGGREFVYVYNAGTTQISKGNVAVIATATTGYSCTVSSAVYGIPVGVCVHATLTTATYGWLCSRGTVEVSAASACAQGTAIAVSTNGAVATYVCGTTGKEFGYTVSASSGSTGMVTAYISC